MRAFASPLALPTASPLALTTASLLALPTALPIALPTASPIALTLVGADGLARAMRPSLLPLALAAALAACTATPPAAESTPPADNAAKPSDAAPAPPPSRLADAAASTSAAPPPGSPAPLPSSPAPGSPLKAWLAGATKIELFTRPSMADESKPAGTIAKADVPATLAAIGVDQQANGPGRRCPDTLQLVFSDDQGKARGTVGFCDPKGIEGALRFEGPEFRPDPSSASRGIKIANPDALRALVRKGAKK